MRGSPPLMLAVSVLAVAVLLAPRAKACGACAVPELWDVQSLSGELAVVTNFGLLTEHAGGWRVTCEEIFGGLLLDAQGDSTEGWISSDVGLFQRMDSACDWSLGSAPEHASWAWKFALAAREAETEAAMEAEPSRFVLVIDRETQALHVERARADEGYQVVQSFEPTSGFRDLKAGGSPASVFLAGFGPGDPRLWQVAFSLDDGDSWDTVVPDLPGATNWVLAGVDPRFPRAVLVEARGGAESSQALWRFDAETGAMKELFTLSEGEVLGGLTVLGDALWVAGRRDKVGSLYRADRRELVFSRVIEAGPAFGCLRAHAGALYTCVNDFTYESSFLLGRSEDDGKSWEPLLTVDDLGHIEGCGPACSRTTDWLTSAFGTSVGAAGATQAAGGEAGMSSAAGDSRADPGAGASGCSCRWGRVRADQNKALWLWLCLGGLWFCRSNGRRLRSGTTRAWSRRWSAFSALLLTACSEKESDSQAAELDCAGRGDDLTSLRLTEGELSLSVLETLPEPPAVGDNVWRLRLDDAAHEPVTGLAPSLRVTAFMPDHGHGTPVSVGVTETDPGHYELAPINTFMPGLWQIRLELTRGVPELFEFNVCVE